MTASIRLCICLASLALLLAACDGGNQTGDDVSVDGGRDGRSDGPITNPVLDPADCAAIAANFAHAATTCGTQLPPGAQGQFETMCKRGIAAAATCGGNPTGGFDCFATQDANDWVCANNEPFPSCNGDLAAALGMYCVIALGNPNCASGIQCQFDADCGAAECNGATGQCFDKSAYCVGLPCEFDADCPNGHTCNNAEGACIGE